MSRVRFTVLLMKSGAKVVLCIARESSGWRVSRVLALRLARTLMTRLSSSSGTPEGGGK